MDDFIKNEILSKILKNIPPEEAMKIFGITKQSFTATPLKFEAMNLSQDDIEAFAKKLANTPCNCEQCSCEDDEDDIPADVLAQTIVVLVSLGCALPEGLVEAWNEGCEE